ncbi:hypothetical protein [Soonwooa sp.]|uniref:hypothetical protein n=1 Tax=Soonwooa sp. TaxID=1938592 RepID=UPI0026062D25|nr:hypothetical protein [Soonwooa sp.]
MKKLLLSTLLIVAASQLNAQMAMPPTKAVTKAIKKNPQILNAINTNPQLLNSLNMNEKLLDAVVDEPQILNLITANPNIINTINGSPDFLKMLTKNEDVVLALSLNPNIVNTLNSNPTLINALAKKPKSINQIASSVAQTSDNSVITQAPTSAVVTEKKQERKKAGLGNMILGAATNGLVGTDPFSSGKLFQKSSDLQTSLDKSKNKNIFLSKRYDDYIIEHKLVAIIPFSVDIEGENKKQITSKKERVRNEKEIEERIQESLYKFLLKNQNNYSIEFQDISTTNLKLKNSGIMSTLYTTNKEDIAKALGVDAVIAGDYVQKMNNKESKSGIIKITLFDGKSGDWVWKLDENAGSKYSLIDETDKLMNSLMDKVVNYFPYRMAK